MEDIETKTSGVESGCALPNDMVEEVDDRCEEKALVAIGDSVYDDDDDDDDITFELEEDIYGMIFLAPIFSASFLYAILVFGVQIAILVLVIVNRLSDPDPNGNFFKIPPLFDYVLNSAQALAILISVFVSNDVVISLDVFLIKYDETIRHHFPGASFTKWILSNILRLVEGVFGVVVAFVFINQSTDVLGLFLDFSAVQFVSELDNVGYFIASKGYLMVKSVQRLTVSMQGVEMSQNEKSDTDDEISRRVLKKRRLFQLLIFYGKLVILMSLWLCVKILQRKGKFYDYECEKFQINLPSKEYAFFRKCKNGEKCPKGWEERNSDLNYSNFSGLYQAKRSEDGTFKLEGRRPIYEQITMASSRYKDRESSPPGIFKYCESEEAWVFTIAGVSKGATVMDCKWLLKSPETEATSLAYIVEEDWKVWTGAVDEADIDITCVECEDTKDITTNETADVGCNFHGECNDQKECLCEENFAGDRCSICAGCELLELVEESGNENNLYMELTSKLEGKFKRLDDSDNRPIEVDGRLVRYHAGEELLSGKWVTKSPLYVFFYWSGRYVFWDIENYLTKTDGDRPCREDLVMFFESFHPAWSLGKEGEEPWYVSDIDRNHWEKTNLKWKSFDDYKENPEYTVGSYKKVKFQCRYPLESQSQCPYR